MQCSNCGQQNGEGMAFCGACGKPLSRAPGAPIPFAMQSGAAPLPSGVAPPVQSPIPFPAYGASPATSPHVVPIAPKLTSPVMAPYFLNAVQAAYQCRVCGTTLGAYHRVCPRCGAPPGTIADANDPTSSQFLPVGFSGGEQWPFGVMPGSPASRPSKKLAIAVVVGALIGIIALIVLVAVALNS